MGVKGVFLLSEALNGRDGHGVGRELLARLYKQATGKALPPIAVTPRGKPYFPDGVWHFSISHTPHYAFCALGDRPLGLDAEEQSRQLNPQLAGKILSPGELAQYRQARDKNAALLRFWVLKEARGKLLGTGIRLWPNHTDFQLSDPAIQEISGCFVAILEE